MKGPDVRSEGKGKDVHVSGLVRLARGGIASGRFGHRCERRARVGGGDVMVCHGYTSVKNRSAATVGRNAPEVTSSLFLTATLLIGRTLSRW